MSTLKVTNIESPSGGGVNAKITDINGGQLSNRNLIINGAMVHDQRNAGAAQSSISGGASVYLVDRWKYYSNQSGKFNSQQNAASVTPPTGFSYYLGLTSTSSYTSVSSDEFALTQSIEGYNVANLEYGTSSAKTSTLSFYVRSSLTGTHSGAIQNGAANRSYPFSFTISTADTWEYKTITFAGDTSGTWLKTEGQGLNVTFNLGSHSGSLGTAGAWAGSNLKGVTGSVSVVGSSGATFYLTGVQLEVGEKATAYSHSSFGDELARCQRYYEEVYMFSSAGNTYLRDTVPFKVAKRAAPTGYVYAQTPGGNGTNTVDKIYQSTGETAASVSNENISSARLDSFGYTANTDAFGRVTIDAEL